MILPKLQSRFDKIDALVKGKGFAASDVSLRGIGAVKRFPQQSLDRFVLQGSQDGDLITYPGMTTTGLLRTGSSFLPYDAVFNLAGPASFTIGGLPFSVTQASNYGAELDSASQYDVATASEVLLSSYTIHCEGIYTPGTRALTVKSAVPVTRGDQWIIWSTQNGQPISHSTTVQDAFKTSNAEQWNIQLLDPLPVGLTPASNIIVQASASAQWDDVPLLKGPCWLGLPIATHLQDSNASMVAYVRLKSSNRVIVDYFTFDPILTISLVPIPSYAWSAAHVSGGIADYQVGATILKPNVDNMTSRLTLEAPLEGDLMEQLKLSIKAEQAGRLYFRYDNGDATFNIQAGIQTLTVPVQGNITWMEISNNIQISLGDISPKTVATSIDVTLHVFNTEGLASHVFQKPTMMGLFRDPSLTWAREHLSASNAGFRVSPAQQFWNFAEGWTPPSYTPYLQVLEPPPPQYPVLTLDYMKAVAYLDSTCGQDLIHARVDNVLHSGATKVRFTDTWNGTTKTVDTPVPMIPNFYEWDWVENTSTMGMEWLDCFVLGSSIPHPVGVHQITATLLDDSGNQIGDVLTASKDLQNNGTFHWSMNNVVQNSNPKMLCGVVYEEPGKSDYQRFVVQTDNLRDYRGYITINTDPEYLRQLHYDFGNGQDNFGYIHRDEWDRDLYSLVGPLTTLGTSAFSFTATAHDVSETKTFNYSVDVYSGVEISCFIGLQSEPEPETTTLILDILVSSDLSAVNDVVISLADANGGTDLLPARLTAPDDFPLDAFTPITWTPSDWSNVSWLGVANCILSFDTSVTPLTSSQGFSLTVTCGPVTRTITAPSSNLWW
jgi:hypothetical protein